MLMSGRVNLFVQAKQPGRDLRLLSDYSTIAQLISKLLEAKLVCKFFRFE